MTAPHPVTPVCPACGGTNTIVFSDGNAHCFDDDHEWDPATVTAIPRADRPAPVTVDTPDVGDVPLPPTPELAPFGLPSVEEVFGPESGAETDGPAGLEREPVGSTVRLEGGQIGFLVGYPDDDHIEVAVSEDRTEIVALSDVEAIFDTVPPEPGPDDEIQAPVAVVSPELVYMLSGMMIRMGIATIIDGPDGPEVGLPPVGWLQIDEELHATIEAAAATTVARLIVGYGIDVDDLLEGLDAENTPPEDGDQETEIP